MVPKRPARGMIHLFRGRCIWQAEWKLGFTIGLGEAPRLRSIQARNLAGLKREIWQAKERFGLPEEVAVLSCYEAG